MGWGTGNLGGGSGGLNFKIVSYATESELLADTPKENTIGVITSIPITGYHFGTEEPSPAAAGMVWISTGTSSAIEFNALKKNAIQVYPISAKQYIGGAWVDVTALSYQGGEWVEWKTYLYNAGAFASGQSLVNCSTGTSGISYTENEDSINIVASNSQGYTYRYFEKPVDLTDKSVVKMTLHSNAAFKESGTLNYTIGASIWADSDTTNDWTSPNTKLKSLAANTDYEVSVDVSALSGEYYIWLKFSFTNTSSGKLDIDILSVEVE